MYIRQSHNMPSLASFRYWLTRARQWLDMPLVMINNTLHLFTTTPRKKRCDDIDMDKI